LEKKKNDKRYKKQLQKRRKNWKKGTWKKVKLKGGEIEIEIREIVVEIVKW